MQMRLVLPVLLWVVSFVVNAATPEEKAAIRDTKLSVWSPHLVPVFPN